MQDSDGDKSDYNLVVDEVSPWSLARDPAQAAVIRFRTLLPQLSGSLGSSSLLLGSSGQPAHVPALLHCVVPAKTDSTPIALGRLCQPGLSFASHRLGSASRSPFSPSAVASHMGRLISWMRAPQSWACCWQLPWREVAGASQHTLALPAPGLEPTSCPAWPSSSLSFNTPEAVSQCRGFTEFQSFAMELPRASGTTSPG